MRPILRSLTFLLCLQLMAMDAFAQADAKPFIGIWELGQASYDGGDLQQKAPGTYKIFRTDGTLAEVQVFKQRSIIVRSGEFVINNATSYTETFSYQSPELPGSIELVKGFKINHEFSEDKKLLIINFDLGKGTTFKEIWRRL